MTTPRHRQRLLRWWGLLLLSALTAKAVEVHVIKPLEPYVPFEEAATKFQEAVWSMSVLDLGRNYFGYLWTAQGANRMAASAIPNLPGVRAIMDAQRRGNNSLWVVAEICLLVNRIWKAFYYTIAVALQTGLLAFVLEALAMALGCIYVYGLSDRPPTSAAGHNLTVGIAIPLAASVAFLALWLVLCAFSLIFLGVAILSSLAIAHASGEKVKEVVESAL